VIHSSTKELAVIIMILGLIYVPFLFALSLKFDFSDI